MNTPLKTRVRRIQASSVLIGVGAALLSIWFLNQFGGGPSGNVLALLGVAGVAAGAGRRLLSS